MTTATTEPATVKGTRKRAPAVLPGWDRLRHGGLLFDGTRLERLSEFVPSALDGYTEGQLRERGNAILDGSGDESLFVAFVLERVCGLDASTGTWTRGSSVAPVWGRRAITGETVKPRHLWKGRREAVLPVFLDGGKRLGIGRGRRIVSHVLGWLRAGNEHLALLTNGRQWRLLFAGLDYDAWCEWDLELWFDEGELAPQVLALRTLLNPELWTPESKGASSRLLQAIRDTRKGQAELSEVLGERVREAVEIVIQAHGEALHALISQSDVDSAEYHDFLADYAGVSQDQAPTELKDMSAGATPEEIYRAACRVAMRLVVILFAESRDLLPRDNALYHGSYGLNGLLDQLEREGGTLADSFAAWPRVLALFRLVRDGSHHPDLPVHAYGGELFAAGDGNAANGVSRALAVFEQACFENQMLSDHDVREMLRRITRTTIRIRQGRAGVRTVVPVDFSDLSSEYLGILYEGLLDYELKKAPSNDPVIFLSVGDQPALPLSRLETMDDAALKALFESLKKKKPADQDEVAEEETEEDEPELELADADATDEGAGFHSDARRRDRTRAETWARRAAQVAALIRKRRGRDTPERRLAYKQDLAEAARRLVARVVLPGEWYLVRWGGTRKGSGSFYTRPGLAVPTVQRTLRPLAYDPPAGADGETDTSAPPVSWTPKSPEQILDLTVCDPACGSGTFPLAALRFLTEALYASLQHHQRIEPDGARSLVRLLGIPRDGGPEQERLVDELIPCPPDDDDFEPRLKAVLRRHVVERCIYAVDLDPLAVELCRLSLWIETMDRTLPFGFLDHKVKCGNSLIGAWFDQFQHYPVMAWKNREGGDKNHSNGVHFAKGARTAAIKAFVKKRLTPNLKLFLRGRDLFQVDLLQKASTAHDQALAVLAEMHALPVQDAAERARRYREDLLGSPALRSLKEAMDLWCACWFWPADEIAVAPLPTTLASPTAETREVSARIVAEMRFFHWELEFPDVFRESGSGFHAILGNPPWDIAKPISMEFFSSIDPLYRSYGKQEAVRKQSDYFDDAVVEHDWLNYNARFRAQSNFTSHAASPFGDPDDNAKSQDRFNITRGFENKELHARWRRARRRTAGFGDPLHSFRHQGSADLNLYKLFLESVHTLLRPVGRLGFVVPSGLYSDKGTGALRRLFLDQCRWEWLFGIENRDKIFPIDSRFKFNPIVVEKGGTTEAIQTAFMRRNLDDWERADELATSYTRAQVERFSPSSRAILEIQSHRDLEILEKIYANSVLLGDQGPDGWGIRYATEFHMTNDSRLFPPRPQWEAKGYRPDEYSRWLLGDWRPIEELWDEMGVDPSQPQPVGIELEDWLFDTSAGPERREVEARFIHGHLLKPGDVARTDWRVRCAQPPYDRLPIPRAAIPAGVILSRDGVAWIREDGITDTALPFYEGRMIGLSDFSHKGWVSGKGRSAVWREIPWDEKRIEPQYLMDQRDYLIDTASLKGLKLAFMDITSSTNARTMIMTPVADLPCGNKTPILAQSHNDVTQTVDLLAIATSVVFDWTVRQRLSGTTLNWYIVESLAVPTPNSCAGGICTKTTQVSLSGVGFAPEWLRFGHLVARPHLHACSRQERLRITAMIDAVVAATMGLSTSDVRHVLTECDRPTGAVDGQRKGFWRIDKDKDPELRQTVLTLVAFHDLESKVSVAGGNREQGVEAFLTQNDGEGWILPEELCLADYELGHDERAKRLQPVARRLGSRFYDYQLVQSAAESWKECHLHARNLLGTHHYAMLLVELIELRFARGEHWIDLLTGQFTHGLLRESGLVTALLDLRPKAILDDADYTEIVTELRAEGIVSEKGYQRLVGTHEESHPLLAECKVRYQETPTARNEQLSLFQIDDSQERDSDADRA